jgi:YbbR domain-containing protein
MKSKILTLLFSFVVAVGLWMYVVTYEYTEIQVDRDIEVQLLGESTLNDRGLIIESGLEQKVNLTIKGKRSDINKLRSADIMVTASLNNIYEAGERELVYEVSFPGNLQNGAIEIVKRKPSTIKVNVAKKLEKDIPVEPVIKGKVPEGYVIDMDNKKLSHQTIHVSGPEEWLNQIEKATVEVDMTDRTESFSDTIKPVLCDKKGNRIEGDLKSVTVSHSKVTVEIPVLKRKTIRLELPIKDGGGLTKADVELKMNVTSITVRGSKSVIDGLPDSVKLGEIDLSKEKGSFKDRVYTIPLKGNFTVEGDQGMTVLVSLLLPEMAERIIDVNYDQINFTNQAEGYTPSLDKKLMVTIRYKKADEAEIEDAVSATVDLEGSTIKGTYSVTIHVKSGVIVEILDAPDRVEVDFFSDT